MIYFIRNTTNDNIYLPDAGISFPANSTNEVSIFDIVKLFNPEFVSYLATGALIFNNGTIDYNFGKAINKLDWTGTNYSHIRICDGDTKIISDDQQSQVIGKIKIDGIYEVDGELWVLNRE